MTSTLMLYLTLLGLLAAMLASTLSYAFRTLSRVELEQALIRRNKQHRLDAILSIRQELALSTSALRMFTTALVVIAAAFYFYGFFPVDHYHALKVFSSTLLIITPLLLIVTVAIPQAWAKYAGEATIATLWPLIRFAHAALYPAVGIMNFFDEIVRRLSGVSLAESPAEEAEQANQEILAVISESTADGTVDEDQKKMIEGVISFRDLQVGQIMTPRPDILALELTASLKDARDRITKDGLSRVPVYENTLDNIIGILYAKDLLTLIPDVAAPLPPFDLRKLLHPPVFVPRTKPLRDLLREFRHQQVHMAIVLDEYGGTIGLVTSEDIIEEIVGEIADEYEKPETPELKRLDQTTIEADARINITELNRELNLNLPENQDYQTLGGFVISTLGVIPTRGQKLELENVTITVLDSEPRRVKRLRLDMKSAAVQETESP